MSGGRHPRIGIPWAAGGGGTPTFLGTHADLSSTGNVSSLTSASWSVSGSNRFLLAFMGSGAGTPANPSSAKWGGSGGTALTQQGSALNIGPYGKLSIFSLVAPTEQTSTSYYLWPSQQDETASGTVAFTGVNQSTPLGTVATATGLGSTTLSPSIAVSSVAGDLVVGAFWMVDQYGTRSITAPGGTILYDAVVASFETLVVQSVVATGTSTTLTFNISGSTENANLLDWGLIGVAVKG